MIAQPIGRIAMASSGDMMMDVTIDDGLVTDGRPGPGGVLHARGRVVTPAFVDAHVHLDKAHLLAHSDSETEPGAGVSAAIATMKELRRSLSTDVVHSGARSAVRALVEHGVVAARAHVEIDEEQGLGLLPLHRTLQDEFAGRIELQLSAFPQNGITPKVVELLDEALASGVEIVGGCPYVDDDQEAHLDVVFDLAQRHGRRVDLHLDFDDDPRGSMIAAVAERTRALGMAGLVSIGHATKLAAMDPDAQGRALDLLAAADVSLVVMPATDLYLNGGSEPGTRSMAPIERAVAAGVRVAVSNNNLRNGFSPYGNGNLLQAAWAAGLIRHMGAPDERKTLLDAISTTPAAILGRDAHGIRPGDRADLVVLDTTESEDLVLQAPPVSATVFGGHLVHRREATELVTAGGVR